MRYRTFDTHKYIKELEASGFKEAQAEVIINSLLASRDFDLGTLATREQVNSFHGEMSLMNKDISLLKEDVTLLKEDVSVLKKDVSLLKEDVFSMKKDIAHLDEKIVGIRRDMVTKEQMKAAISALESKILKWVVPSLLGVMITGFGIVITILLRGLR